MQVITVAILGGVILNLQINAGPHTFLLLRVTFPCVELAAIPRGGRGTGNG
jgi:hypothetical protein